MQEYKKLIASKTPEKDIDYSRALGTERIAAHWITLAPQTRSSSPHAESLEEEFIYIVKGRPHIWINGYLYQLEEKMCVGFKAGTGISHTVINNTAEPIELIVLGERTKKENRFVFPVNPELNDQHKDHWWSNCPTHEMGPHDGNVDNLNYQRPIEEIPFIKSIVNVNREASFSYPEDTENFGNGVRLSDLVDLVKLGVWHEILKPQKRSAWPHAHKVEEEMAIVLSGKAEAWINGYIYSLKKGDAVYFKPNTNYAHVLINNSSEDFEYIGLGESKLEEGQKDLIHYPLHETRNEQCRQGNSHWESAPKVENFGDHFGLPEICDIKIDIEKGAFGFLQKTESFLYNREAEYSLMIGLCEQQLKLNKNDYQYLTVLQNEKLIGVAIITDKNLIITSTPEPIAKKLVEFIIESKLTFPGIVGPSISAEAFARIYSKLTNKKYKQAMGQKIYENIKVKAPLSIMGQAQLAEDTHIDLVAHWLLEFAQESLPHEPTTIEKTMMLMSTKIKNKEVYIWFDENKNPVSMCCVARPTQNGIAINAVYTPKNKRKQGYASAVVAHATQIMLDQGKKFCVLYTDILNPTSNKIYQDIGYVEVASSKQYLIFE